MNRTQVVLATVLILGGLGVVFWHVTRSNSNDDPSFICGYPRLLQIRQGLSKDDVVRILGPANEEIDKSKTPHNFFQGTAEKEIRRLDLRGEGLAREDRSLLRPERQSAQE